MRRPAATEVSMLADWLREWDRNRYRKSLRELRQARQQPNATAPENPNDR